MKTFKLDPEAPVAGSLGMVFAGLLLAVGLFAFAGSASAASITNVEYSNGDVTIQGNGGQQVSGKVRIEVGPGEVVEKTQFDAISDSLAPVCVAVGGDKGLEEGTHFVNIPGGVKFPPNTGTYDLDVTTHGIFGGLAADDCVGDQNGSQSFSGSIRTVGGSSSSVGSVSSFDQLLAQVASLTAQVGCWSQGNIWDGNMCKPKPAPVVTKPAFCSTYAVAAAGGTLSLQMWLVQNSFMTQAQMNTGPGTYGPRTTAAVGAAMAACL